MTTAAAQSHQFAPVHSISFNTNASSGYPSTGEVFITGSNLLINTALGLAVGDQLFILENDGTDPIIGTFAFLANGAMFTADGVTFQIFYDANGGAAPFGPAVGNDIELSVVRVAVVPEPSTWMGGIIGFVGFAYWQRRRFAQLLHRA